MSIHHFFVDFYSPFIITIPMLPILRRIATQPIQTRSFSVVKEGNKVCLYERFSFVSRLSALSRMQRAISTISKSALHWMTSSTMTRRMEY